MPNATAFIGKSEEDLGSAEADFAAGRYNACARNSYYAVVHAAVAALIGEGIRPAARWEHKFVHDRFSGLLVYRRKRYDSRFRTVLSAAFRVRLGADYTDQRTPASRARRTLEAARDLIAVVKERQHGNS